jgi:hypothetical protein
MLFQFWGVTRGGKIGGGRPAGSGDCRRSRSRQRPGLGAKGGGGHGGSIPTLTLSWGGAREQLPRRRQTAGSGGWGGSVSGAVERKEGCGGSMARWWTTRKPGAICRRPKAVRGGKYRWWGSPVEAVLGGRPDSRSPAMGRLEQDDGTAWAGGWVGRGGSVGAGHPAACGGAGGADGDGAGRRSKWRPAACGLVV